MSALRSKLRGKVHLLANKGRQTMCGRSLGNMIEEASETDPAIFDNEGSNILVKMSGMEGVSCHPCRWGRDGNVRIRSY